MDVRITVTLTDKEIRDLVQEKAKAAAGNIAGSSQIKLYAESDQSATGDVPINKVRAEVSFERPMR